jgi:hypothetical protein
MMFNFVDITVSMFLVEITASFVAGSVSLRADALERRRPSRIPSPTIRSRKRPRRRLAGSAHAGGEI